MRFPANYLPCIAALLTSASTLCAQFTPEAPRDLAAFKKLSLAELMDVEVTSVSRRAEKISAVPSSVQVITGDDLHRAGATRLPAALRLFSNLEVARLDARQWAITGRGFNNTLANKLLVLLDGRTLYTPLYAGVFWDVQDTFLEDVDRIEVISGPGATQWGSNAVNGVINITSKNAKDTQGGLLFGGLGTESRRTGGARYGGQLAPNAYYRAYAKYSEADAAVLPNGAAAGDAWHQLSGGMRLDWERAGRDRFTLQGDAYTGRFGQLTNRAVAASGGNLLGRWSRTLAPDADLKLQAYYDQTFRRIPGSITEDLKTYDLDFQNHLRPHPAHDLVWGLGYRMIDDAVTNTRTLAFLPPDVQRHWYSAFAQDEFTFPARAWHLTVGSKLEHNPYTGLEIQPSARLAWKARPAVLVWGAVSRAVRTPSRIDRDFYVPPPSPTVLNGGPHFGAEKLLAYELGLRAQPRAEFTYSISSFFHDYDDLRSLEPENAAATSFILANGLRGRSYGAELAVDYRVAPSVQLHLGYTELRVRSWTKPGSADRTSVRSQVLDPNRQLVLRGQFDLAAHTFLDATLRSVGAIRNQQLGGYTELDLRLGWQPAPAWELAVTGTNLLHARHAEFGAPLTRRAIERNVSTTVTWRF